MNFFNRLSRIFLAKASKRCLAHDRSVTRDCSSLPFRAVATVCILVICCGRKGFKSGSVAEVRNIFSLKQLLQFHLCDACNIRRAISILLHVCIIVCLIFHYWGVTHFLKVHFFYQRCPHTTTVCQYGSNMSNNRTVIWILFLGLICFNLKYHLQAWLNWQIVLQNWLDERNKIP